jgi:hypothetical protein
MLKNASGASLVLAALALTVSQTSAAPPDHAGGIPKISACMEIVAPGSYRVANNLPGTSALFPDGDCIRVGADNVTIDLDGFEINGGGSFGAGITDNGVARQATTIRNGTITGFAFGIDFNIDAPGSEGTVVEEVRAIKNGYGMRVGWSGVVRNSVAQDNGSNGIFVRGGGSVVAHNLVTGNDGHGIFTDAGTVVIGNSARFNGGNGINANAPTTLVNNTASENDGDGIAVSSGVQLAGSVVSGNTAVANGEDGIDVNAVGSVVSGNSVTGNTVDGLSVECPSNVFDNAAVGNGGVSGTNNLVLLNTTFSEFCDAINNLASTATPPS